MNVRRSKAPASPITSFRFTTIPSRQRVSRGRAAQRFDSGSDSGSGKIREKINGHPEAARSFIYSPQLADCQTVEARWCHLFALLGLPSRSSSRKWSRCGGSPGVWLHQSRDRLMFCRRESRRVVRVSWLPCPS